MHAIFETIFDIAYLLGITGMGITMIAKSKGNKQFLLFGIMSVVLGVGDAFHLVPRVIVLNTTGLENYTYMLGVGKLVTSITMTLFYVLLYHVYQSRYQVVGNRAISVTVYILALLRIILCLMPQNAWTVLNPPLEWGIYRNIPFVILGLLIIVLFYKSAKVHKDTEFKHMWLTIVISFGFYLPVVLFASQVPIIGMLMIPKMCAYAWTVWIGFSAIKKAVL